MYRFHSFQCLYVHFPGLGRHIVLSCRLTCSVNTLNSQIMSISPLLQMHCRVYTRQRGRDYWSPPDVHLSAHPRDQVVFGWACYLGVSEVPPHRRSNSCRATLRHMINNLYGTGEKAALLQLTFVWRLRSHTMVGMLSSAWSDTAQHNSMLIRRLRCRQAIETLV